MGARRLINLMQVVCWKKLRKKRRETKENPEMCSFEAFAQADMTFARTHGILEGSARANMNPLERTPFVERPLERTSLHSSEPEVETGGHFLIPRRSDASLLTLYNPYDPL